MRGGFTVKGEGFVCAAAQNSSNSPATLGENFYLGRYNRDTPTDANASKFPSFCVP
jgi:hypothetical protein